MKTKPIKHLPIVHPATKSLMPDVILTINGYEASQPNLKLHLDSCGLTYLCNKSNTPSYERQLAKAISNQAMLIGWWLSKLYQLDTHPTAPFNISRSFKVVIGPWSHTLRSELSRLNLTCYAEGKINGQKALVLLGE